MEIRCRHITSYWNNGIFVRKFPALNNDKSMSVNAMLRIRIKSCILDTCEIDSSSLSIWKWFCLALQIYAKHYTNAKHFSLQRPQRAVVSLQRDFSIKVTKWSNYFDERELPSDIRLHELTAENSVSTTWTTLITIIIIAMMVVGLRFTISQCNCQTNGKVVADTLNMQDFYLVLAFLIFLIVCSSFQQYLYFALYLLRFFFVFV